MQNNTIHIIRWRRKRYFFPVVVPEINFDVTADWPIYYGVVLDSDFLEFLQQVSNPDATVSNFSLVGHRLQAQVTNVDVLPLEAIAAVGVLPEMVKNLSITASPELISVPAFPPALEQLTMYGNDVFTDMPGFPATVVSVNCNTMPLLSSFPAIPPVVRTLICAGNNLNTASLDVLVAQFLIGSLPKLLWDSRDQVTTDQPSSAEQTSLDWVGNVGSSFY